MKTRFVVIAAAVLLCLGGMAQADDKSLSFDGGDRVIIANTAALNPSQITVECWVSFDRLAYNTGLAARNAQFLVSKGGDRTTGSFWLVQTGSQPGVYTLGFGIGHYTANALLHVPAPLDTNHWYHVAGSYDGQTVSVYLDGSLLGSKSIGPVVLGCSSPVYLSYNDVAGFDYFLTGQMDEVRIWNYARTAQEIQSTMNIPLTGSEPGLVGYWNFNEAVDSQTTLDQTPNGSNGQLGSTLDVDTDDPTRVPRTSFNAPPAIVSLSDTLDPVREGNDLNLSAGGVSDPDGAETIVDVKFYRESNGTPGLQTGAGGDNLVGTDSSSDGGWTAAVAITGLAAGAYTYYAQATDNQGAVSNVVLTISTVQTGLTISEMKLLPDGGPVETGGSIISALWSNFFYIEADDRSSGIRVEKNGHGLMEDKRANVTGVVRTNDDGERYVEASDAVEWGSGTAAPLGMGGRFVGGGDWRYDASTGAGQRGIKDGFGLNNIGLLVRVWGRVAASGTNADPRRPITWLYVDDGSNVQDGAGVTGLYCEAASNLPPPSVGSYVCVTGVSSCEFYNRGLVNVLRIRSLEDIQVAPPAHSVSIPAATDGEPGVPIFRYVGHSFLATGSTCSYGHPVEYSFDWEDGTSSAWSTSLTASHSWSATGTFGITVTARCQVNPELSATSPVLTINVGVMP